ncbi:unnamed protein product [Rhizoctonia solani]|uniref:DUF6533 domain-containing protein n=1 Tax=Rhizoctonia solani TaxID=456999 RepID=A0A8H3CT51_9AGAM|nr:unnamed protein product [Rhizoctonia solani]
MSTTTYVPELLANLETAIHNIPHWEASSNHLLFEVVIHPVLIVVGYALLIYDHILTFPEEVQFIWTAKRSPVVIMFLLNRYITPIVLAIDLYDKGGIAEYSSRTFCVTWYFMEAIWYIISFGIIHALVAMRASSQPIIRILGKHSDSMLFQVIAIWGRPRWIVVLLSSLWLTYFCTTLGILLASLFTKAHTVHFEPLIKVCYLTIAPFLWSCWVPPLLLEIVLFSLSCVQAFQAGKFTTRTPIIHVLFRDGALHFIVILGILLLSISPDRLSKKKFSFPACSVFNMVTWIVAPPTLVALAKYFGLPMVNVMISRMVLNLRSCQGQSRAHHFVATPGGGIQVHVSTDEVELSAVTWNSKGQGQELEAQVGARAGLSPSRSTFKL